jgi:hypothetical protein
VADRFDDWIDRVLQRATELRQSGVLSIGVDGCTATFAPADPIPVSADEVEDDPSWIEPQNPWEDPASYPSGIVPQLQVDELPREDRQ